ncbi:fimbrial biogenesis usher protein [Superficieibacter sp. HKU1]|uniref:fimbrial biogenesis usher protein n=1 Tax=Superficieibacter sp. HKU1 TaxID=3031919 RepID=UPI0023E262B0|nr:fimbrial biogenesis usher protein [Superficieibacter sp. HKU1]WES70585.1 fimbrial biogenesis usher protein [Superficieibacter sp. HKU1]
MKGTKQSVKPGVQCWLTPLTLAMASLLTPAKGRAENYFNPAFLSDDPAAVADLSHFEGNEQAPGTYRVDVYLNKNFLASRDIRFTAAKPVLSASVQALRDDTGLSACLTPGALAQMGVNLAQFPALAAAAPESCIDVGAAIPAASSRFDFARQRLDISIPQAAIKNNARGYIPPAQWDEGVNALTLNYDFTGANSRDNSEGSVTSNNYFLGLNSGLNLGAWRLRDYSTWSYNSGSEEKKSDWQHISTYVERDVIPLKGELTAGDSYTPADVFDSLPFRGMQIASDDNMLPDSMKGFAPTIHGIANSNAQVTIKQNGYTIYQSYVPPGAFTIKDLYSTSASGDLTVEVKESDGTLHSYVVPYSAVPVLQREGRMKYAVTAAEYRGDSSQKEDVKFGQATLLWGLPHGFTLYGGSQFSDRYTAAALGSGVNMGELGAISADITQARSTLADDSSHQGQSVRLLYAKSLENVGTHIQLMGYRYSTSGFYTLDETAWRHMEGYTGQPDDDDKPQWQDYYSLYYTKRGKVQINLSQPLGRMGSIFFTGSKQSYWHTDETNSLLQIGYSGTLDSVNWSLTYNYTKAPGERESDQIFALSLSLPLSQWLMPDDDVAAGHHHNVYATYNASSDKHHNVTQNAGISGTLLDDNNLSYSVQQGYQNHGVGASGNASVEYDGAWGNANVGYNDSNNGDYRQVNYGLSGGIVAHAHGITLSQPLGNTNVLIAAPGASNVKVEGEPGVHTDWRGYAVVPYATTYRQNRLALDVDSMADDVDVDDAVTNVVPTEGALVRATFKAHVGERALLTLLHLGKPVPFGATVTRDDAEDETIVGDSGETYLSGLSERGTLNVQWGDKPDQHCVAHFQLPALQQPLVRQQVECN